MNALAWDPLAPELRDPFGGQDDLRRRLVRAVGDPAARFAEDGLRPMRAVRFAAQLGYGPRPGDARRHPGRARGGPQGVGRADRGRARPARRRPSRGRRRSDSCARRASSRSSCPALAAAARRRSSITRSRCWPRAPADAAVRLAALLHVLARGRGGSGSCSSCACPAGSATGSPRCSRGHACRVRAPAPPLPRAPAEVRRWLSAVGLERAEPLLALADAEAERAPAGAGRRRRATRWRASRRTWTRSRRARPPLFPQDLALDGRAVMAILGAGPGPHVGEALRHLLDRVLEEPATERARGARGRAARVVAARGPASGALTRRAFSERAAAGTCPSPDAVARVLCIEQDEALAGAREGAARAGGLRRRHAPPRGSTGSRAPSRCPPDLVLADVHLPDIEGYELAARLKREHDARERPVPRGGRLARGARRRARRRRRRLHRSGAIDGDLPGGGARVPRREARAAARGGRARAAAGALRLDGRAARVAPSRASGAPRRGSSSSTG